MNPLNPDDLLPQNRKKPNFLLIVILSVIFLVCALGSVVFLLKERARKMMPHPPNGTPNSLLVRPLDPHDPGVRSI